MADVHPDAVGFISKAPRLGFVGGFDGARGILVISVVLAHILPDEFESFSISVDFFYTMSAFLIVTLLMQEHRDNGRVNLRKFYARRAVRLLPSAYAYMLTWIVVGLIALAVGFELENGRSVIGEVLKDVAAALAYVYNLVFPLGLAAVAPEEATRPLGQFWSLSIEEQFYMFVAVAMVFAFKRNWMKQVAVVSVAVAVWIGLSRWRVDLGPLPGAQLSASIWTRGLDLLWMQRPDALFVGVVAAVVNAKMPTELPARWRSPILAAGTIGGVVFVFTFILSAKAFNSVGWPFYLPNIPNAVQSTDGPLLCSETAGDPFEKCTDTLYFLRIGHSLSTFSCVLPMVAMSRYKDWWVNRFLSIRLFRYLGRMSYTIYIWHLLPIVLFGGAVEDSGPLVRIVFLLGMTMAFSIPVHHLIEKRALQVKLRYAAEKEVLDLRTGEMVTLDEAKGEPPPEKPSPEGD